MNGREYPGAAHGIVAFKWRNYDTEYAHGLTLFELPRIAFYYDSGFLVVIRKVVMNLVDDVGYRPVQVDLLTNEFIRCAGDPRDRNGFVALRNEAPFRILRRFTMGRKSFHDEKPYEVC